MKNFRNNLLRGVSILALLGGSYGLAQEKKERHVFLLIGQSNMAGRAKIEVEDKKTIDGAFLWNIGKKKWEAAVPPYNLQSPSRKNVKMQQLNCGPSFVNAYSEKHPGVEVGIVCAARGGTSIGQWDKKKPDNFDLYHHAIEATKAALAEGGELKGILWHQGEGDSGEKNLPFYPEKLVQLIANLREDLKSPKLPFVYSQVGQWKPEYEGFNEMIVKQPAKIEGTACITTEGLKNFDDAHFNSAGQRELGERFAVAMEKLLSDK